MMHSGGSRIYIYIYIYIYIFFFFFFFFLNKIDKQLLEAPTDIHWQPVSSQYPDIKLD